MGVLGSHSAEEVGISASSNGFDTLVVCQKGREQFYTQYNAFLFGHQLILQKFQDLTRPKNIRKLQEKNVVWFPNRSFSVYLDLESIENDFPIPIYGSRNLLGIEDRRIQYKLLDQAKIRRPQEFENPDDVDRLAIVKVQQKSNPLERAFFYISSPDEYDQKSKHLIKQDIIDESALTESIIEEFVIGPRFNANFQSYGLSDEFGKFDFVGFDDRIQTNLSGLLNLPAHDQLGLNVPITNEEIGHKGVTMRESKKPLVYEAAKRFIETTQRTHPPGIIGLFALQGAITKESDFIVFDVSPRIPGSPCLGPTSPEMRRLRLKYNQDIFSPLDLCMMELRKAIDTERLGEVTT
ncbi:MAG: DUF1297 domain-containing protein [Candidatus Thorarchaeota archaeon]